MPTVKDIVIKKPDAQLAAQCSKWPIWTKEQSKFEWEYTQTEQCLILEGKVTICDIDDPKKSVSFGAGDFVQFPDGLKCVWDIRESVRKHYNFI